MARKSKSRSYASTVQVEDPCAILASRAKNEVEARDDYAIQSKRPIFNKAEQAMFKEQSHEEDIHFTENRRAQQQRGCIRS